MLLMDRIKITPFLSFSFSEQLEKIRSVQLLRSNGLKEAAQKRARKETKKAEAKTSKVKTARKQKALTAIDSMSLEELEALIKKHNLTI